MYICHACGRTTSAVRTGPQELSCSRCGVVGFVEEASRRNVFVTPVQQVRVVNPLDIIHALMRDMETVTNPGLVVTEGAPVGFFRGFMPFLPDAVHQLITHDNFDNLVSLIMAQQGNSGPPPAAEVVRRSLPEEILTSVSATRYGECSVCQESYQAGEIICRLSDDPQKCSHIFHKSCILPWLELHNTCPVCRFQLRTDDPDFESRRQTVEQSLNRSLSSRGGPNLSREPSQQADPRSLSRDVFMPDASHGMMPGPDPGMLRRRERSADEQPRPARPLPSRSPLTRTTPQGGYEPRRLLPNHHSFSRGPDLSNASPSVQEARAAAQPRTNSAPLAGSSPLYRHASSPTSGTPLFARTAPPMGAAPRLAPPMGAAPRLAPPMGAAPRLAPQLSRVGSNGAPPAELAPRSPRPYARSDRTHCAAADASRRPAAARGSGPVQFFEDLRREFARFFEN